MRVALAQLNPVVGDVAGNLCRVEETLKKVQSARPALVVFPELFLTGYPPLDLLERGWFVDRVERALAQVAELSRRYEGTGILVGAPVRTGRNAGKPLHNAALIFHNGQEILCQPKRLLPTYDVFDETRYFEPAGESRVVEFSGEMIGVAVCEDAWSTPGRGQVSDVRSLMSEVRTWSGRYDQDPVADLARTGARLIVTISASPFCVGKEEARYDLFREHARRHRVACVFVNQVGANDELVFDGRSMVFDAEGKPVRVMEPFTEQVSVVETRDEGSDDRYVPQDKTESVYRALVLGVADYARKCGFSQAVLGLSGGIDSAVACCIAASALGPQNVLGITMPSEYSSLGSVEDSRKLSESLGIELREIPIGDVYRSYLATLARADFDAQDGITLAEENLQARVRGNIVMAYSNRFGHLVITTGNKSELAVGYCTLYGDMSGGLAALADVPKTMVYRLAQFVNREREVIPRATIEKPPSAELRPGQTDQDTLPPYEVLDEILSRYVEDGESVETITSAGFDCKTVEWAVRAIRRSEYKRRQAAPGIKVTSKAFGPGRRMPIAARY